jgi:hypothetical protein
MSFFGSGSTTNCTNSSSNSNISGSQQQSGCLDALASVAIGGFAWDDNTAVNTDDAAMSPITDDIAITADTTGSATASAALNGLDLLADSVIDNSSSSTSSSANNSNDKRRVVTAGGRFKKYASM